MGKQVSLTAISLFSGLGLMDEGMERAGFKIVYSVEIDKWCNAQRKILWPDVPQHDDIKTFTGSMCATSDLIFGGSPCQDLSCAGKQAGLIGERSGLFYEMLRIVGELQPRWVVWENVRGAISSNRGRDFLAVLNAFWRAGYDARWCCLRASDFGYPHQRARIFLLADSAERQRHCEPHNGFRTPETTRGGSNQLADPAQRGQRELRQSSGRKRQPDGGDKALADADGRGRWPQGDEEQQAGGIDRGCGVVADAIGPDESGRLSAGRQAKSGWPCGERGGRGGIPRCPPGPGQREQWAAILERWPWLAPAVERGLCGVADGRSWDLSQDRRKWLKALGNGVVTDCAYYIGRRIMESLNTTQQGDK